MWMRMMLVKLRESAVVALENTNAKNSKLVEM